MILTKDSLRKRKHSLSKESLAKEPLQKESLSKGALGKGKRKDPLEKYKGRDLLSKATLRKDNLPEKVLSKHEAFLAKRKALLASKYAKKKLYTEYSKLTEIRLITIGFASPEKVKTWGEKRLPNGKIIGEVVNGSTVNYKTLRPLKGGLFCERLFGPINDFECACGLAQKDYQDIYKSKVKKSKSKPKTKANSSNPESDSKGPESDSKGPLIFKQVEGSFFGNIFNKRRYFCHICDVEFTWSIMRRYQLSYINLVCPVAHLWYVKGSPGHLSNLLAVRKKDLESIIYGSTVLTLENVFNTLISVDEKNEFPETEDIFDSWHKLQKKMKMKPKKAKKEEPKKTISSLFSPDLSERKIQKLLKGMDHPEKARRIYEKIKTRKNIKFNPNTIISSNLYPSKFEKPRGILSTPRLKGEPFASRPFASRRIASSLLERMERGRRAKRKDEGERRTSSERMPFGKTPFGQKRPNSLLLTSSPKVNSPFLSLGLPTSFPLLSLEEGEKDEKKGHPNKKIIKRQYERINKAKRDPREEIKQRSENASRIYTNRIFQGTFKNQNPKLFFDRLFQSEMQSQTFSNIPFKNVARFLKRRLNKNQSFLNLNQRKSQLSSPLASNVNLLKKNGNQIYSNTSRLLKRKLQSTYQEYFKKLNIKNVKLLARLILQFKRILPKESVNKPTLNKPTFFPKLILKKSSIPFYILLNMSLFSPSSKAIRFNSFEFIWRQFNHPISIFKKLNLRIKNLFEKWRCLSIKNPIEMARLRLTPFHLAQLPSRLISRDFVSRRTSLLRSSSPFALPLRSSSSQPVVSSPKGRSSDTTGCEEGERRKEKVGGSQKAFSLLEKQSAKGRINKGQSDKGQINKGQIDVKKKKMMKKKLMKKKRVTALLPSDLSNPDFLASDPKKMNKLFRLIDSKNLIPTTIEDDLLKGFIKKFSFLGEAKDQYKNRLLLHYSYFCIKYIKQHLPFLYSLSSVKVALSRIFQRTRLLKTPSLPFRVSSYGVIKQPYLLTDSRKHSKVRHFQNSTKLDSLFYTEFYTLSNFPSSVINVLISKRLVKPDQLRLSQNPAFQNASQRLTDYFSNYFFKHYLKKGSFASIVFLKSLLSYPIVSVKDPIQRISSLFPIPVLSSPKGRGKGKNPQRGMPRDAMKGKGERRRDTERKSEEGMQRRSDNGVKHAKPEIKLVQEFVKEHYRLSWNPKTKIEKKKIRMRPKTLNFGFQCPPVSSIYFKNGSQSEPRYWFEDRYSLVKFREPIIHSYYAGSVSVTDTHYVRDRYFQKYLIKRAYNPIYLFSYYECWNSEKRWDRYVPYLSGNDATHDFIISTYKDLYKLPVKGDYLTPKIHRFNKTTPIQSSWASNSDFLSSIYSKKNIFVSGPGTISYLLDEYTPTEIKRMANHNRLLLEMCQKRIGVLKYEIVHFDMMDEDKEKLIELLLEEFKKRSNLQRRTKLTRKMFLKGTSPRSMLITVLPVLPPELRPVIKMGDQVNIADLNKLYQRVIYRNNRLKKTLKDSSTNQIVEVQYTQRLLQESVDNLIQNGRNKLNSEKDKQGRLLTSLSDSLKGKQGRFRQYLLGKRVDYSGRSVIVVGPKLKLHECGLPREMAVVLYYPFLLKRILNEKLAQTVTGARHLIDSNSAFIWQYLRELMCTCPVLLNRAPTLHRLGIQAFQPKLIDGRAILLHPLVCSAFNADFDGDQMAVHLPLTLEARAEAWKLMLSRNNILAPSTGDPLAIPSQDMVLGCYYLTTNLLSTQINYFSKRKGSGSYFAQMEHVIKAYELHELDLHANIWLRWSGFIENGAEIDEPIEIQVERSGKSKEIYKQVQKLFKGLPNQPRRFIPQCQYIMTTPGKILFNLKIQENSRFIK